MEINGFQVERHGSGFAVSVRVHVGSEEEAGELVSRFMEQFSLSLNLGDDAEFEEVDNGESDTAAGGRKARPAEAGGSDGGEDSGSAGPARRGRSRSRGAAAGASVSSDAAAGDDDAEATGPTTGRARGRSRGKASAAAAPAGEVKDEGPTTGRGRRRGARASAAGEEAESQQEDPTESAPRAAGRRGSRRKTAATAVETKSPSEDTAGKAAGGAGRRGRGRSKSGQDDASGASSAKISDEDLTKAASTAAQDIGAAGVMEVLDEFGVESLGKLAAGDRQDFLDRLKEEREKE